MKSFFYKSILIFLLSIQVFPQITTFPTWENFEYALGTLHTVGIPNWTRISGTGNDLNVSAGNLTYAAYQEATLGNNITVNNSAADDLKLSFTSITSANVGSKRYVSFLMNVINNTGLGTAYFAILGNGASNFIYRLYAKPGGGAGTFNIGIGKGAVPAAYSGDLNIGETYLIVMGYEVVSGAGNDILRLWINPTLNVPEPAAISTVSTGTDGTIDGFYLRQATGIPFANIDAIKVFDNWDNALPVELTSFTGSVVHGEVHLNWKTSSEVNNYGFDVERSNNNSEFIKLGFVNGSGNSNSVKEYTYIDKTAGPGKYQYRLKQIDTDGTFEYSPVVDVDLNSLPEEYSIKQNYPNPFNPSTKISYSLPYESRVNLTIYNAVGELVSEMNKVQEAGNYEYDFTASNLKSGIYFYKLQAEALDGKASFTGTLKMLLLK